MYTREEKGQLVNRLLDKNNHNKQRCCDELKSCLGQDTNETYKLYKYKPVSVYTLKNIIDNTLYCASPDSFNDPFDCYVGTSFWELYVEALSVNIDGEWNIIASFFKKIISCNQNSKKVKTMKKYQRNIYLKIVGDECLWNFVTLFASQENNSLERLNLIQENQWVIKTIIGYMIQDKEFKKQLPFISENYQIMFQDSQDVTNDSTTDEKQLIINKVKEKAPDKLESVLQVYEGLESTAEKLNKSINDKMRVGCLCASKDDIRMWAYYANGHQGVVIEFDYTNIKFKYNSTIPLPVIYSEKRPSIPYRSLVSNTNTNQEDDTRDLAIGLLHKGKSWEDEREWRIVINNTEPQNFPMPPITCIYLGAKINDVDKAIVIQIAKSKNIPVKQMVLDKKEFILRAIDVD